MTRIDIFSGFLGAGKTTLIRKLIAEGYKGEKLVLIENEFGDIAIDGGFLKDAGVEINELNSGCICCTLVGDFTKALQQVMEQFHPDRIIIEPSGVGKLSEVASAVENVEGAKIGAKLTVVDASKCKMYMRNFGEFFNDQVQSADLIVLSRTGNIKPEKLIEAYDLLKDLNPKAGLISTPWDDIGGEQIVEAMDKNALRAELEAMEHEHHHHEHHHHEHDENCSCGCHEHEHEHHHEHEEHEHCHHHEHQGDEACHEHHHHHQGEGCPHDHEHEHEHHHHHEHDENCTCGCHDHEHEHHHHHEHGPDCSCGCHDHHHADEMFQSWGMETPRKFTEDELRRILESLGDEERFGTVLRAKGILDSGEGQWIYFDYVPGEMELRRGAAELTGRFCVIGANINETALKELFKIG